ncbi:MAG: Coenzyme F420 hydrogenase/dehydrogenase, beta subunit C-terminal domain [Candidatus Omnitrophica bacterium]|nr:Coenzyme F420 hydrogenase/dehydrogenase, beta subunit C-terminal domain [Candidatus Omnitrophota bacterium]
MSILDKITKKRICTGCGTCYSVCPLDAIQIKEDFEQGINLPKIDESICSECGLCLNICPQNSLLKGIENPNDFFGSMQYCFYGCSANYHLRIESTSGGLATAISSFCLEQGIVSSVVNVIPNEDNPLRYRATLSTTVKDIMKNKGAKYCPVSLNVILKEIAKRKSEDCLYIGLPCHVKGLKKAMEFLPELHTKIKYVITIFCGNVPNFKGTDFILDKYKIKKESVKKLDYRGRGWPGGMSISCSGQDRFLPSKEYWNKYFANYYFISDYCFVCDDLFGREGDISIGDAWLPRFSEDNQGTSIGIARTSKGSQLLDKCVENGCIYLNHIEKKEVLRSQLEKVKFKTGAYGWRKAFLLGEYKKFLNIDSSLGYNSLILSNNFLSKNVFFKYFLLNYFGNIYFRILAKLRFKLLRLIEDFS